MKIHRAILIGLALLTICWPLAAQAAAQNNPGFNSFEVAHD